MANDFYDHTTFPTYGSTSSSAAMQAELDAIEAGFDKLPTLSGNASKIVRVNAGETALEATDFPATTGNGGKLLAVNAGATGFEATATPALGTPASGTLTNCTGLPASAVVNTPAGSIAAVTVQNAINELDTEKAAKAGSASQSFAMLNGTVAGTLSLTGAASTLGYGTGAGGTVTQATNKFTTVTLNRPSGQITMNNAALAAGATATFVLNNTLLTTEQNIFFTEVNVTGSRRYSLDWNIGNGYAYVHVTNETAVSLSDAVVINFAIVKGAVS